MKDSAPLLLTSLPSDFRGYRHRHAKIHNGIGARILANLADASKERNMFSKTYRIKK